jgi:hypothetical protein
MKSVLTVSVIAGLIAGLFSTILGVTGWSLGLYGIFEPPKIGEMINFSIGWIMVTVIFCITFGFIYEKIYSSIPGKGIKKGLYFGLFIWFIKDIAAGTYCIYSGTMIHGLWEWVAIGVNLIVLGVYMWPIYGLVLGYLYKK